jgi:hypothetical protein
VTPCATASALQLAQNRAAPCALLAQNQQRTPARRAPSNHSDSGAPASHTDRTFRTVDIDFPFVRIGDRIDTIADPDENIAIGIDRIGDPIDRIGDPIDKIGDAIDSVANPIDRFRVPLAWC